MSINAQEMQTLMQEYQRLEDEKPDDVLGLSPRQQWIKELFVEIGFRIGVDEYGNVAFYLMKLAHSNVFGAM